MGGREGAFNWSVGRGRENTCVGKYSLNFTNRIDLRGIGRVDRREGRGGGRGGVQS